MLWNRRSVKVDPAALWEKVKAFQIDVPGAPYPFSKRLAKEQCWSDSLAAAAIEEYKRFMFLAAAAGHPVTPSFTVDEVWHLHLIYTKSYWEELCVNVLNCMVHHDPGSGIAADESLFIKQYERTLQSYRKFFGEPPRAIWGDKNGEYNVRARAGIAAQLPPNADCRT